MRKTIIRPRNINSTPKLDTQQALLSRFVPLIYVTCKHHSVNYLLSCLSNYTAHIYLKLEKQEFTPNIATQIPTPQPYSYVFYFFFIFSSILSFGCVKTSLFAVVFFSFSFIYFNFSKTKIKFDLVLRRPNPAIALLERISNNQMVATDKEENTTHFIT